MTPCESVVKKIMGEPYAGNPQVRFEEEGGNPTFTLRYVDGMSLYRGYFVMNGVDPTGELYIFQPTQTVSVPVGASRTLNINIGELRGELKGGKTNWSNSIGISITSDNGSCENCQFIQTVRTELTVITTTGESKNMAGKFNKHGDYGTIRLDGTGQFYGGPTEHSSFQSSMFDRPSANFMVNDQDMTGDVQIDVERGDDLKRV